MKITKITEKNSKYHDKYAKFNSLVEELKEGLNQTQGIIPVEDEIRLRTALAKRNQNLIDILKQY